MEFKDKIKNRRSELNLTLEDVAKKVGVSAPTIQRYESGEIQNVRRDKIKLLADALDVTPDYLMGWDEKKQVNSDEVYESNEKYGIQTLAAHIQSELGLTEEMAKKVIEIAKTLKDL